MCGRGVNSRSKAIDCDSCGIWTHIKCCGFISDELYSTLNENKTNFEFLCTKCTFDELPFIKCDIFDSFDNSSILHDESESTVNFRDTCHSFNCFERKGMHFIHFNIRSILPKISEIRHFTSKFKVSVIAVTETWLDGSVTDQEVKLDGYNVIRRDRDRQGGGVCLYIHEDLAFSERRDLEKDNIEAVWADILLPKTKPILVGSCYRPPKQNDFITLFESVLASFRSDTEWFILGDLNICFLNKKSVLYKNFIQILSIFNLTQIVLEPTRITASSTSLLDHIICSHPDKIIQSGTLPVGLSDHLPVFCTRKIQKGTFNKHKNIVIRSLKNYTAETFIHNLKLCDWSGMFTAKSVEESWLFFKEKFSGVLNFVAPIKQIRLKQRSEPWLDSNILEQISIRDKYLYKYKKYKQKDMYILYCYHRNLVQRLVKKAKSEYISHQLEENKYNSKRLWSQLKDLGYSNKTKSSPNVVLNIDNENCFEPSKIACHFNTFFTTVASVLVDKLPVPFNIFTVESDTFKQFYKDRNPNDIKFKLHTVSEEYIYKELCKLNCSKSTGLDDIPAKYLKDAAPFLKIHITFLVNSSITSNIVPSDLKCAKVKPLFKKNNRSDVSNYRPVSILSIVSKILERAVYNQLEFFLIKQELLYEFQSGFRCNYSTDSCLIHLTDHIKSQTSKGLYTGMIMLDLQKAFDTVDHGILCQKLNIMGVESVEWFQSYLTGRNQIVNVNNAMSESMNITCGVPQGSILGPLLFLCYVNDMSISISKKCKLILYADDSTILFSHKDPDVISSVLGNELENCSKWLVDNKLSLHLGKTECILFSSKKKLSKIKNFSVECNNHSIVSQPSVKYLGSVLDNDLSATSIVNSIVKKINSRIRFLYRQKHCLNMDMKKLLCNSLVQCHFDYASSSWYSGITKQLKHRLQVAQNKVVRFIHGYDFRTSLTVNDFSSIGWLNVENRVKQLRLNHVHKIYNKKCPSYMYENFCLVSDMHGYNSRNSKCNFYVQPANSFTINTFYYQAVQDWNSLPLCIKNVRNKFEFKRKVKSMLTDNMKLTEESDFIFY